MKSQILFRISLPMLFLATTVVLPPVFGAESRETSPPGTKSSQIRNFDDFARDLNLSSFYERRVSGVDPLRIAILDNGFQGYEAELGKSLPARTQFHPGPLAANGPADRHGLVMAQLLYGLMTNRGRVARYEPELHLYNTFGYDNFKSAIDDVIARKVDIVLYSQVWEYGGNGDGRGFIDGLVAPALDAGVLWVNAAGDFGVTTYSAPVRTVEDDWVELPDPNHGLQIRCLPSARGECPLRLVLSWNDFKDDVSLGTNKDLDLVLVDDTLNVIQASTLAQVEKKADDNPAQSLYPREILTARLKPGMYYVRVKDRSHNFGTRDRLRITATGESILMPRHTEGESLLNPADLPGVIAVGASDTEMSSESRSLRKPELKTPSLVSLGGEISPAGSSSAAAAAAAGLAILKMVHPDWDRGALLRGFAVELQHPRGGSGAPVIAEGSALSLPLLGFGPTARGCFAPVNTQSLNVPGYARALLQSGGTLVSTTAGPRIFIDSDPLSLGKGLSRDYPNDAVVLGPEGLQVFPRAAVATLGAAYCEVLQVPRGQRICGAGEGQPQWPQQPQQQPQWPQRQPQSPPQRQRAPLSPRAVPRRSDAPSRPEPADRLSLPPVLNGDDD